MKRFVLILISLFSLMLSFTDYSETTNNYPSKVISLGPYVTENLLLLGINDEIIGVTIHEKPEIKKGRFLVGTLLDPNIEAIVNLKPDLVIASKEGNRKQTIEKISNLGINVVVLDEVKTFEDLKLNFIKLAEIFGKQKIAKKIIVDIEKELAKHSKDISWKKRKKIFWQLGTKPLVTAGKDSYFNEISEYAGVENLFGNLKTKYITVNTEEVIKRNPDIIVAMGMGEDFYIRDFWKPFQTVNAVKNKKIFKVDDYDFCSPTPKSFLKSVKTISEFAKN
ncbi:MAG: helical backbone metal receptor [Candidatus Omnitrophica bacterium]|nr:helical backbone metal receptor [Candidatus Omnitrophota bacterium]